jgi:quercetin dioxygenase-like cupin family protein
MSQTQGNIDNFGPHADGYEWVWAGDVEPRQLFPGIHAQVLWRGRNGAKAVLTTIEPGAVWGGEDHHSPGPEEVFVVSGCSTTA